MGVRVNSGRIVVLQDVFLADSRCKNGFLVKMSVCPFTLPVGNY